MATSPRWRSLRLRPETELYLGLIHHDDAAGDAARLAAARRHVRVDGIATECGMARGDPGAAAGAARRPCAGRDVGLHDPAITPQGRAQGVARAPPRRGPTKRAEDAPAELGDVVHDGEHRRHEHQRQQRRGHQAADHGNRHRRAELAARAHAVGRRQHAADHGDGGHDDGPRALAAGIDDGLGARHAALHLLDGEVDQHDGVLGDDAHQHQDADHHRQADRLAR